MTVRLGAIAATAILAAFAAPAFAGDEPWAERAIKTHVDQSALAGKLDTRPLGR